jgi:hypothetical protein
VGALTKLEKPHYTSGEPALHLYKNALTFDKWDTKCKGIFVKVQGWLS